MPAGTVTFLLTDIEGSTRLWESDPEAMVRAVAAHYVVLSDVVGRHGGVHPVEQGEGDSVVAAFARASDAVAAALEAQLALSSEAWPGELELRVRMALHTAEAQLRDEGNYFGVGLSRCARLRGLAHGGQVLLSRAVHDLVADRLPDGAALVDLGTRRLRDLGRPEHVFALSHPDLPASAAPLRALEAVPNNLPDQLTSFVGREHELEEIAHALGGTRLLTLTGAGGCGKTRLALRAVADGLERFADGAWWVELASLGEPELVGDALAVAVGVRPLPGVTALEAVCAYLASRRALVVLDNCEHLLEAAGQVAEALQRGCPRVTVLATSRAPLGVGGETDWRVPSLSVPPDSGPQSLEAVRRSDAGRLFCERALKVRPGWVVGAESAGAVGRICRELDGIPLAIELAAARMRMLSVAQIADGLSDRFRLLTGGARGALPRYRTLRASVDWSHELLDERQRVLFRRLGVFAGGWTLEAVQEVCAGGGLDRGAILELLGALVEQSLVVVEEAGAAVRYRLLETVRQYALERLIESGEADVVRDRHRDAYLALAERAAPDLEAGRPSDWLVLLDPEVANFAAAAEWAVRTDPERALRLCVALYWWWFTQLRLAEGRVVFGLALDAAPPGPSPLLARALWSRGYLAVARGEFRDAVPYARQALAMAEELGEAGTASRALVDLAHATNMYLDPAAARADFGRARELARAGDDHWSLVHATQLVAISYVIQGEHARARALFEDVIGLAEHASRDRVGLHWFALGDMALTDGDLELARRCLEREREAAEGWNFLAMADADLGAVDVYEGNAERGLERMLPRLEQTIATGWGLAVPWLLLRIALAELATGRLEAARERCEALIAQLEGRDHYRAGLALVVLAEAWRLIGDETAATTAAQRAVEAGEALGSSYLATAPRLTLARLGTARGKWAAAERHAHAHLDACVEGDHRRDIPDVLDALAEVAAGLDSREEAVRLLAAAGRARAELGTARWRPEHDNWARLEAWLKEAMGHEAFEAAWARGAELTPYEAIAWVRRARGSRKRPPGGWESLTPTERQVAELAAQGLTNPEIGERMFISRATVKVHLAHVYAKLGVKNRSALAAETARRQTANHS